MPNPVLQVRVNPDIMEKLRLLSEHCDMSVSQIVRPCIERFAKREAKKVEASGKANCS